MSQTHLILFNKPMNVLCQFKKDTPTQKTLADYIKVPNFYPAGRLDKDSEGLLILTDDGKAQAKISHPKFKLPKTYWAQVEGIPSEEKLLELSQGIVLKDGKTRPAEIALMAEPALLWERDPPIRYRKNVETSWIKLTLREGKNRQVRRMTAAIGHPTLRLIRYAIGPWNIETLKNGAHQRLIVDHHSF